MESCEFCTEGSEFNGNAAQVQEHTRSVHPMEYTIAGKQAADIPLTEGEKQFVEEQEAKEKSTKTTKSKAKAKAKDND